MNWTFLVIFAPPVLAFLIGAGLARGLFRRHKALLTEGTEELRNAEGMMGDATTAIEELRAMADSERERADEYQRKWASQVGIIEQVIREREDIWKIYQSAALGAGNAQRLLTDRLNDANTILQGHKELLRLTVEPLTKTNPTLAAQCGKAAAARLPELSDEMKEFLTESRAAAQALPSLPPSPVPSANPSGAPVRIVSRETLGTP